jgi:hypothetical protein
MRKDWHNLPPAIKSSIESQSWSIQIEKNVVEILEDGGVNRADIEAIIWRSVTMYLTVLKVSSDVQLNHSHWHWDHTGDPSVFPVSVKLIVGPGFKEALLPGWPANNNGLILESDYRYSS